MDPKMKSTSPKTAFLKTVKSCFRLDFSVKETDGGQHREVPSREVKQDCCL